MRKAFMTGDNIKEEIYEMIEGICDGIVDEAAPEKAYPEEWDIDGVKRRIQETFFFDIAIDSLDIGSLTKEGFKEANKREGIRCLQAKGGGVW
jgi:preprotein translocase subunit SecA